MKNPRWLLGLFLLVSTVQLAVPLSMVVREERTLAVGETYRFRCSPIDPYDPFRGRYVALGFDATARGIPSEEPFEPGATAFATLEVGDDGFARVGALTREPRADATSLQVTVRKARHGMAWIDLPFDRYFLNETVAPDAERVYRDAVRDRDLDTWIDVRVRDTGATPVGLYIDGVPIEEYVRGLDPS